MAVAAPLLVLMALWSSPPERLPVGSRIPVVVLSLAPPDTEPYTRTSDLVRRVGQFLEPRLRVVARSPEQLGLDLNRVDACTSGERIACLVDAVRAAAPDEGARPAYLLVLALHQGGREGDLVLPLFIDVEAALRVRPSRERREDELFESALFTTATFAPTSALETSLEKLLRGGLEARLTEAGLARPFSRALLALPAAGMLISVDGHRVGSASSTVAELVDLEPGLHTVEALDPSGRFETGSAALDARAEAVAQVELRLLPRSALVGTLNRAATISGATILTAGLVFSVLAAVTAPERRVGLPCTGAGCPPDRSSFASFCESFDDPARCGSSGVLVAPLGMALGAAGAGVLLSTLIEGDDRELPWVWWLASVALGGATYALSASF